MTTRTRCLPIGCCILLCAMAVAWLPAAHSQQPSPSQKLWVFIGTYTEGKSKGIYRAEFDIVSGEFTKPVLVAETVNPSFLAIHPSKKFLYAVNEIGNYNGKKAGAVSAFALNADKGTLKALNQVSSVGTIPCHIVTDRAGKHALIANYGTGSTTVLAIGKDGRLGKVTSFIQHKGSGANPKRQTGPHAHCVQLDANERFAFVADLGLDKLLVYRFGKGGMITPNDPPSVTLPPGSGPRHFAFHPNGKWVYVINEMKSTATSMNYNAKQGKLKAKQTISTLPKGFKGNTSTAEILVHPSGKFVYGSNRGHDSISIFAVNAKTGNLKLIGHQGKNIKTPRNFRIDPTGTYLMVANQGADSIVVFRINADTGMLSPMGVRIEVPRPVCLRMMYH